MTIRKGQEWGELRAPPSDMLVVATDAALREQVERGYDGPVGLVGGDMMKTLGGTGDESRFHDGELVPHLPIDVVRVVIDGNTETLFVAHLIAGRVSWRGAVTAVMNAEFRGSWDVAPRSHPNDGKVDIVTVQKELGLQQRMMARSRVRTGTHVPHPLISIVPRSSATLEFTSPAPIVLDGVDMGRARHLEITVVADAVTVCV